MKAFWEKYGHKAVLWQAAALVLSLALVGVSLMFVYRDSINITAKSSQNGEVMPDAEFNIEAKGSGITVESLRERITLKPELAYDLTDAGNGLYVLTPLQPLEAGTELEILAAGKNGGEGKTFFFTVRNVLQVRSFFPADSGTKVPLNTGIEVSFNANNIALDAFKKSFSIEPEVEGEVTFGDSRFVFYPTGALEPNTKYTVTIAQPLESATRAQLTESVQFSFVTVSAEEEWAKSVFQLGSDAISLNTVSTEAPIVQIYVDENIIKPEQQFSVDVYAYNGYEDYRAQLEKTLSQPTYKYGASLDVDTAELDFRSAFDAVPVAIAEGEDNYRYNGRRLVLFPEAVPEGWYLVELTTTLGENTASQQLLLQVSDISVFHMTSGNNMLAWVNDAKTGEAMGGAKIEFAGGYKASGVTAADGTVSITNGVYTSLPDNNGRDNSGTVFTVTAGDRVFVDGDYLYNREDEQREARKYMSYIFTDRPIYHTSDTIRVWGTVRPRRGDTPPLTNATLSFGDGMAETDVKIQPDGSFTADLTYENMENNYWSRLVLKLGDVILQDMYIRVEDFVKPVYVASVSSDKPIYATYDGEVPKLSVEVSTYDGTPASSIGLEVGSYDGLTVTPGAVITDENGRASVNARFMDDVNTWRPQSASYYFGNSGAESENFRVSGGLYSVQRNVMIGMDITQNARGIDIKLNTNKVTLGRIKTADDIWTKDIMRGAPIAREITAELHRVYYTKVSTGIYYDFISRTSKESYRYDRHDDIERTQKVKTMADGTGAIRDLPKSDKENWYYIDISTEDENANIVKTTAYLGLEYDRGYGDNIVHSYGLNKKVEQEKLDLNIFGEENYGSLYRLKSEFEDDETVSFELYDNNELVTQMQGRVLYTVVQDDYMSTAVSDKALVTLPFDERYVPNYVITGAYFDGKNIYALENKFMSFNPKARELEITLAPDKPSYAPAETMAVEASVKNKATGQPAADAQVVLSVVDEAIFAIEEQNIDILTRLYADAFHPYISKYTSYIQTLYNDGGEKGGGGGDDQARVDFKDTAFFGVAQTGADGKASFTVKLPDNITEWRLTSLALTQNGRAGSTKAGVKATKPFFVMPIVPKQALTGDTVSIGLRSAGTGVKDTDDVKYTVTVKGDAFTQGDEIHSGVKEYDFVSFNGLAAGDYTVTVAGECGAFKDTVVLPFTVLSSGIEVSLTKTMELKNGIAIEPLRYPVSLVIYDKAYRFYSSVRSDIMQGGTRTDMRIARKYAAGLFKEQGSEWYDEEALTDNFTDVRRGAMYSLFPYSDSDIEFTVKACLAMPELTHEAYLKTMSISDSSWVKGSKSAFYIADALSGKEIPSVLKEMAMTDPALTYVDRMYLATALAVSGKTADAQECYNTFVKAKLTEVISPSGEKSYYIKPIGEKLSAQACTAAASMLASTLHAPEAEGLVRYLMDKPSQYEPYILEKIIYLNNFPQPKDAGGKISYMLDGKLVTEELKNGCKYLTLTKQQLRDADFKVLAGDVYVDAHYTGAADGTAGADKKLIGVTKTLEPVGGVFKRGALVQITINCDFSKLDTFNESPNVTIDDYIPTGMRYESYAGRPGENGVDWYLQSRQEQRVRFATWSFGSKTASIVYYARCVAEGDYVVESAYANSMFGDIWGASPRSTVTLK